MHPAVAQLPGPPPRDQQGASHSALSLEVCTFLWHPLSLHHLPLPRQVPLHGRPLSPECRTGRVPTWPIPSSWHACPHCPAGLLPSASLLPAQLKGLPEPCRGAERCPLSRAYRGHEGHGAARARGQECTQTPGHRVGGGGGPLSTSGWAPRHCPGPAGEEGRFGKADVGRALCRNAGRPRLFPPRRDRGRWQLGAENAGGGSDGRPPPWDPGDAAFSGSQPPALCQLCAAGPALRNPMPVGRGPGAADGLPGPGRGACVTDCVCRQEQGCPVSKTQGQPGLRLGPLGGVKALSLSFPGIVPPAPFSGGRRVTSLRSQGSARNPLSVPG